MKILFYIIISILNFFICDDEEHMNYIIDKIYLGDSIAAENETYLKEYNISHVINCAEELTSVYKDLKFLELSLYDGSLQNLFPKFEIAYKYIKKHQNNNILIHCAAGVSRSASLVIFYLMKEKGWDLKTSLNYTREKRPVVDPNEGFLEQLGNYSEKYIKNK